MRVCITELISSCITKPERHDGQHALAISWFAKLELCFVINAVTSQHTHMPPSA